MCAPLPIVSPSLYCPMLCVRPFRVDYKRLCVVCRVHLPDSRHASAAVCRPVRTLRRMASPPPSVLSSHPARMSPHTPGGPPSPAQQPVSGPACLGQAGRPRLLRSRPSSRRCGQSWRACPCEVCGRRLGAQHGSPAHESFGWQARPRQRGTSLWRWRAATRRGATLGELGER